MPYPENDTITCRACGAEMQISQTATEARYVCQECDAVIRIWIQVDDGREAVDPRHIC